MEKNGQLTFSDDPLLPEMNEVRLLMEAGEFADAVMKTDALFARDPSYPGLEEAYRTARYWQPRADEAQHKPEGIDRANFYMDQWKEFSDYAEKKNLNDSSAFIAARTYVYHSAAEHFKIAFHLNQAEKFGNLLNLGICFMNLGEYQNAVEAFEYAKNSIKTDARIISLLAESYYQSGDIPKSLLLFREAFYMDPSLVDPGMIRAKPIVDLIESARSLKTACPDPREWVPVLGHVGDIFYVKRQINIQQMESIRKEVYTYERSYQSLKEDMRAASPITPRLITRYLWLFDYYSFQNYNYENISQIRDRLIELDRNLFADYFKSLRK